VLNAKRLEPACKNVQGQNFAPLSALKEPVSLLWYPFFSTLLSSHSIFHHRREVLVTIKDHYEADTLLFGAPSLPAK
jgi:hypothetical protein